MSTMLRIILLLSPIATAAYALRHIRKSRMQIEDAIFWIFFALTLVILGIFPGIAIWAAELIGIQSPVNLIFLVMLFLMIYRVFSLTSKVSRLEARVKQLAQVYAIDKKEEHDQI